MCEPPAWNSREPRVSVHVMNRHWMLHTFPVVFVGVLLCVMPHLALFFSLGEPSIRLDVSPPGKVFVHVSDHLLEIRSGGGIFLNHAPTAADALPAQFARLVRGAGGQHPTILIRAASETRFSRVKPVITAARVAGFERVILLPAECEFDLMYMLD